MEAAMYLGCSHFRALNQGIWVLVGVALLAQAAMAQRAPNTTNPSNRGSAPARTPSSTDNSTQPIFVSGKVMLEGGGTLLEPVAIERICGGVIRREGYSDSKG